MPAVGWPVGSFAAMGVATPDELLRLGRKALAAADWQRARDFFEQAAEFGETAEALDGLGEALEFGGEHARAIEVKERAFAEYERRGLRAEAAELARWLAFLYMSVHGNPAAANGWMARAESLLEGVEECAAHGWLMLDRAPWSSDASEREQLATEAIAIARIAMARGDLALAEDLVRLCLENRSPSDPDCPSLLGLLVEVQLARGDVATAAETLDRLAALAAHSKADRTRAVARLAEATVRAALGDERARADFQAAVELFSVLSLPLEAAQARAALARTLGSFAPAAAVEEARLALETFERLGATRDADATAAFLRALGAPARTFPKGYGTLTRRESEVLSLLAEGCSNTEIADRLYISRRTAEHHVARILSKLGLRNRAEAAAYALREQTGKPVAK
jgi:DNA-binding CsgD family transcriptional regulator